MTINLPKDLKGFAYDRVLIADMNTFDVDLLLPALFFRVISGGYSRGRRIHDSTAIAFYMDQLASHALVEGFSDPHSRHVLERFMRSTVLHIGKKGLSHSEEQIEGVAATTLVAFKPDFPVEKSRIRRVDTLVYRMLKAELGGEEACRAFFKTVFGKGAVIFGPPVPNGHYDGLTQLDTVTRVALAFLDGFEPSSIHLSKERVHSPIIPGATKGMARDLGRYFRAYQRAMPMEALAFHAKALINFHLFSYTAKLFHALPALVANPKTMPPAMVGDTQPSPPEVFLDFEDIPGTRSREMATECVRRELNAAHRFVQANLTLRQMDQYVSKITTNPRFTPKVQAILGETGEGPGYLAALLRLLQEDSIVNGIELRAEDDEMRVRDENTLSTGSFEDEPANHNTEIDRIVSGADSQLDRVIRLLIAGQPKINTNTVAWYWSVGGLTKPHGILVGHLKNRNSWRYAPSNDLLATLVQLAAVDIPDWDEADPRPQPIKLRDFLDWLERRFGILVDRPPEPFSGPDYVAAAQDNLRAMLRHLQQMGIFRDLSDDFTVQELIPPYVDVEEHVAS